MRKITSWIVLGIGIVLIIGSILISRNNVSIAAFATGYYEILPLQDSVFLLNKNTGTTWLLTEDKGESCWLRVQAK